MVKRFTLFIIGSLRLIRIITGKTRRQRYYSLIYL